MTTAQTPAPVKHGSAAHKRLIESGYGMSMAKADAIVKERKADPRSWPFEKFEQAEAMLEAAKAKPRPVSPKPGWKRDRS